MFGYSIIMNVLNLALAAFFFMVTYILFCNFLSGDVDANPMEMLEDTPLPTGYAGPDERHPATKGVGSAIKKDNKNKKGAGHTTKEVIYTQDYYPWWRSTRWWNYDGWLYQKP